MCVQHLMHELNRLIAKALCDKEKKKRYSFVSNRIRIHFYAIIIYQFSRRLCHKRFAEMSRCVRVCVCCVSGARCRLYSSPQYTYIINKFLHIYYYYSHEIFFSQDLYSVFNSNRFGYFYNDMCCTVGAFELRLIPWTHAVG